MTKQIRIVSGGRAFRIDMLSQSLFRENDEYIPLPPRQWDLLGFFLSNPGKLLTKDQLFESVWAGQIVTDEAISHAVRSLRSALGDNAKQPLFIETVHSRGYRFIAEVCETELDSTPVDGIEVTSAQRQWLPGDDPLIVNLEQMNQADTRQLLRAVGDFERMMWWWSGSWTGCRAP